MDDNFLSKELKKKINELGQLHLDAVETEIFFKYIECLEKSITDTKGHAEKIIGLVMDNLA